MEPTAVSVEDFLAAQRARVPRQRIADARLLIDAMSAMTGEAPVMWGPSIIGFGSMAYATDAGTTGIMPRLAFSPRAANLTFYFPEGWDGYREHLHRLGPHRTSVSCLYVTRLDRIDIAVLRGMLETSYRHTLEREPLADPRRAPGGQRH